MSQPTADQNAMVRGLLDESLLSGQHEVQTVLRPERHARPVAADDLPAALAEIEWACQMWGGGGQPLLPVDNGDLPEAYLKLLEVEQIDFVSGRQEHTLQLPTRVRALARWEKPVVLVHASQPKRSEVPVQVVALAADDPWRPIYAAVLGLWPEGPDAEMTERYLLRDGLRYDEVIPVERITTVGSLVDLVERAASRRHWTPRSAANMFLSYGLAPDTSFLGDSQQVLPNLRTLRRAAGPNIVVAISPGSVADLALLWNLRGAHGEGRALPIGIPVDQITPEDLGYLAEPGRATMFGLGGGKCCLVSASVPLSRLEEIANESPAIAASAYDKVLTFGPAPGRVRSHLCHWTNGRTRLDPMSETDAEVVSVLASQRSLSLTLDVAVDSFPLPADPTMRGTEHFGRFQAGAAQVQVSGLREQSTVVVDWPAGWTCLAAVAKTRGLEVAPSEPGLAATTLIRSLGGVWQIGLLQHQGLIDLLYRMGERSGMSWWRRRWRDFRADLVAVGADTDALDAAQERLDRDDPVVAPPGEGRAVPFSEFRTALGSESAASNWVAWAERRHLIVRGATVVCPDCRASTWLPLAALPPPVACPGCGRGIEHPYNPDRLQFTYRLGEPLRRTLETDSLGHVFTLHWFAQLFDRSGYIGAYPGVVFTDPADPGRTIGEADVLLLFADGSLVPVEVKRTGAGVDAGAIDLMNRLAVALRAPWDALAVLLPAREAAGVVEHERRLPDRPRFVITTDQLFNDRVFWALGDDPFKWNPCSEADDRERRQQFSRRYLATDPDRPLDQLAERLLTGPDRHERRGSAAADDERTAR